MRLRSHAGAPADSVEQFLAVPQGVAIPSLTPVRHPRGQNNAYRKNPDADQSQPLRNNQPPHDEQRHSFLAIATVPLRDTRRRDAKVAPADGDPDHSHQPPLAAG
jgi:hypothetical protein